MWQDLQRDILEEFAEHRPGLAELSGGDGLVSFKVTNHGAAKRQNHPIIDQHGTEYPSAEAAARMLGIDSGNIGHVLAGRRKSVHGYTFTRVP